MEISGLDKIKQIEENNKVGITGLDMIRPIDEEQDIREDVNIEEETRRAEEQELSYDNFGSNSDPVNIIGLDKIRRIAEPELPKLASFSLELIGLVSKAKELDHKLHEFGADKHQYKFHPVLPISYVEGFQKRHNISLPQGYIDFLTQVGNGGAGPDHGLYTLDEVEFNNYCCHSPVSCSYAMVRARQDYHTISYTIEEKEPLVGLADDEEKWFEWYENLGRVCISGGDHTRLSTELYNGLVQIASTDGGNAIYLICSGEFSGQVAAFTLQIDDRIHLYHMTFEEWMLNHFKGIIEKYNN